MSQCIYNLGKSIGFIIKLLAILFRRTKLKSGFRVFYSLCVNKFLEL